MAGIPDLGIDRVSRIGNFPGMGRQNGQRNETSSCSQHTISQCNSCHRQCNTSLSQRKHTWMPTFGLHNAHIISSAKSMGYEISFTLPYLDIKYTFIFRTIGLDLAIDHSFCRFVIVSCDKCSQIGLQRNALNLFSARYLVLNSMIFSNCFGFHMIEPIEEEEKKLQDFTYPV